MAEASPLAIETEGLTKHFGATRAVESLDLRVEASAITAVLGPNGAGKTTAIRMLATLLTPTSGTARVFGHDVVQEADRVRGMVSLTGQFASVDEDLTGTENLVLLARLWGYARAAARSRAAQLLEAFGLAAAAGRQVKTYSGGMRRRLDIAASIVVTPRLVFLDEPTTGLDPRSRNQVWAIIRAMVDQGTTVLLTTQYLDEADQLADRIAVVDHGRVIAEGTGATLKASVGAGVLRVRLREPSERPRASTLVGDTLGVGVELERDPAVLSARVDTAGPAGRAIAALDAAGIEVDDVGFGQPSLDEVFLALTGRDEAPILEGGR